MPDARVISTELGPTASPFNVSGDAALLRERSLASDVSGTALEHEHSRTSVNSDRTPTYRKKEKAKMGGDFIKVQLEPKEEDIGHTATSAWKRKLRFLNRKWIPNCIAGVVVFDAVTTCLSIDIRAAQLENPDIELPRLISLLMDLCVVVYSIEFAVNLILKGRRYFRDWMTWIDLLVLICGWMEVFTRLFPQYPAELDLAQNLRILRLVRIFRLTNFLRKARELRELQKMVTMLGTCLKTLAWSFVFCFGMMTIWSMLLVEIVHPMAADFYAEDPQIEEFQEGYQSTSSIMAANLLLFKTVIAGDSWGKIAVPIIRKQPATAIIFCGSLLTLVFGVLNLIVAVIVDTFAEARERDIMNLAEELELNHEDDKKFLKKIFDRLDREGQGEVSLQDLVQGARQDPEFQSRLRVMDIDEVDLEQLFDMIDSDGSGTVEADEFIAPLSRWVHESKTATRFIKYNLMRAMHQQEDFFDKCQREFRELQHRMNSLANCMECSLSNRILENSNGSSQHPDLLQQNTESLEIMDSFVAAPDLDLEIEQPRGSKNEGPKELLRSAFESAERRLAKGSAEALKRSLQVLEGVLQDLVRDLQLDHLDAEKNSLFTPTRYRRESSTRSSSGERGERRDKEFSHQSRRSPSESLNGRRGVGTEERVPPDDTSFKKPRQPTVQVI